MKLRSILLLSIALISWFKISLCVDSNVAPDPLLVVVIMVKDETEVIKPTLEMYCKADPKGEKIAYVVYDTGLEPWSPTMENAERLFKEYNLTNYYIYQEPFQDFATSRNRALDFVEEKFPNAGFMLMPDAEWYMHNVEELLSFCQDELAYPDHTSYLVRIVSTDLDFGTQRLIRCKSGLRFGGVVHETITIGTRYKTPPTIYFELRPQRAGMEKTQKRWQRDRVLLTRAFEQNPKDSRTCFYLAQTLDCIGDLESARKYYELRTHLVGWPEEDFMARYRLAQVLERMAQKGQAEWKDALDEYLKAFAMRPTRAEAIIKLAAHYLLEGNHAVAYLFSRRACEMDYPAQDTLFVEKEAYDYVRHDILGQSGWYVGQFDIGEKSVREALKVHDNYPHLYRNLNFYLERRLTLQNAAPVA